MSEQLIILKTDTRHRVRTPVSQREALLDAFERTCMSGAQFAAHHGIRYSTFAGWCQKRRRSRGVTIIEPMEPPPTPLGWAQAVLASEHMPAHDDAPESPSARPLSVTLPGGATLLLESMAQVPLAAALLRAVPSSSVPNSSPSLTC